jgi:hypothetical protein
VSWVLVYLAAYFLIALGAVIVLWQSGILAELPLAWTGLALLVVVALGIVLGLTSRAPRIRAD